MRGGFNTILRIACPYATPQSPNRDGFPRSIKELEYSLTLRTLDTYAANIVVISRYQYVRLLPARVISAYAAPTLFAIFFYHVFTARYSAAQTLKIISPNSEGNRGESENYTKRGIGEKGAERQQQGASKCARQSFKIPQNLLRA